MTEWQPIETAPKDTAVLLYNNMVSVGHFNSLLDRWIAFGRETPDTLALSSSPPSHWMPLPKPPAKKEKA